MKRSFDFITALFVLIVTAPMLFIIAVLIKIESRGPIVFRQPRVGREGVEFCIFKFRSMVNGADKKGPHYTASDDNRITKVGRFIRKTSIDELPQLFNVLQGNMSLVGPRPNVIAQKGEYTENEWCKRNSVRPGITGLAQATLRSEATPEERTALDLEYVDKSSFVFDLQIMLMTVKQIVSKGGN